MSPLRISLSTGRFAPPGFIPFALGETPQDWEARLDALPWADGEAAEILVHDCLHRLGLADGLRLLRECRRILAPGGVIGVQVPDPGASAEGCSNPWERANRLAFEQGWRWFFTESGLRRALELAGLEPAEDIEVPGAGAAGADGMPTSIRAAARVPERSAVDPEPLVSVLLPAYKPAWFEEALRSACEQTYRNLEIVVCDDSGDETIGRIAARVRDGRIRYERNPRRLGARANYDRCLELAGGEYIKFLNDDDLLEPECVERLLEALLSCPSARLAASPRRIIDAQGRVAGELGIALPEPALIEGRSLARMLLVTGKNLVGEPTTTLFHRTDAEALRPHRFSLEGPALPGIGDLALWVRLLGQGDCVYLSEALSRFRIHAQQYQRDPELTGQVERSWRRLRERAGALGLFGAPDEEQSLRWRPLGGGEWKRTPWSRAEKNHPEAGQAKDFLGVLHPEMEKHYAQWCRKHSLEVIEGELFAERLMLRWKHRPAFHLIVHLEPGRETALADTLDTLGAQLYPHWGLSVLSEQPCPQPEFEALPNLEWIQLEPGADPVAAANLAVAETGADWVAWIPAGVRLAPELLIKCGDYVQIRPQWRLIYTDSDRLDPLGRRHDPRFRPDFNPDLLRSMPYMGSLCLVRGDALLECGGFGTEEGNDAALQAYALAFRIQERHGPGGIGHIADVLYHEPAGEPFLPESRRSRAVLKEHLERCGEAAEVEPGRLPGTHRVRYRHGRTPLVSLIVHTRDRLEFLEPCIESVLDKTRYPRFELIVVDNQSEDPDTLAYLDALRHRDPERIRVLPYPHPFNFAAQSNLAARHARGEYLLFLNNDTQIVQPEWLDEMMAHALRPEVGVVGARLVFPESGKLQHAGCVLGMGGNRLAHHPYLGLLDLDDPGYLGRAQVDQNYSAVTGACLLVRRSLYEAVDGMDEARFRVLYNDVDLCLKIAREGARVVWTPHATVVHHGNASLQAAVRDPAAAAEHVERVAGEDAALLERWADVIAGDPAYNRHLTLLRPDVTVESDVVINWDPNFHDRPRVLGIASGGGSGEYRVVHPLRAVSRAGLAQTDVVQSSRYLHTRVLTLGELVRAAPDTLLVHTALGDGELALLEKARRHLELELVYGLDDLVTRIPEKSSAYRRFTGNFRDARRRLRTALGLCDRVVVTTEPLAELCAGMIDEVHIVPNYLERDVWGRYTALRTERERPRVGWAGAQQHQGDLELMLPVVQATAGEVDWIFFGMCPDALRPYVAEVHPFEIGYEDYVAKLATLDLDLAVAPLEIHPFNEAKSNLRILEYGFFGWPVVCTDILPYQGAPVARVPNDPARWIQAIRERIHDAESARAEGERLQRWVHERWMLEDHVADWAAALVGATARPGESLRAAAGG